MAILTVLFRLGIGVAVLAAALLVIGRFTHLGVVAYRLALGLSVGTLISGYFVLWAATRTFAAPVVYGVVPCVLLMEAGISLYLALASPVRYVGLPLALCGFVIAARLVLP
jgi:hypothetical protein